MVRLVPVDPRRFAPSRYRRDAAVLRALEEAVCPSAARRCFAYSFGMDTSETLTDDSHETYGTSPADGGAGYPVREIPARNEQTLLPVVWRN